jgi:alkylation response protein AidB-like acyl-CoA dehydrogenase
VEFTLSSEQQLLKDGAARFAAEPDGARNDRWKMFADLGWLAIGAPESLGGFGGPVERMLLLEQFGRGLVISPYVAQAVFAPAILAAAGRLDLLAAAIEGSRRFAVAYEEPYARYDPACVDTIAERSGDGWTLRGTKTRVLDPSTADTFIVSARTGRGIGLFAVPSSAPNLRCRAYPAEDGHDVADLHVEGVCVDGDAPVGASGEGLELLDAGLDHAAGALCAEALGLCEVMLETTVGYTKERRQFDAPLSSFQALQHRMADMYVELELMRSMAYLASMTLEGESDPFARKRALSAARAQAAKSGRFIGQQAIQLHGGIGMSEEYRVGHYFKRMTLVERLLGDRDFHLRRYVELSYALSREPVAV